MKKDMHVGRYAEKIAAKCGMSSSKLLAASLLAVFLISASYVFLAFATPSINFVSPSPANNTNTSNNWTYINITATENLNISIVQWGNQSGFVNVTMTNTSMTVWGINMSGLADRTYNYTILAQNTTGAWNQTGMQFVTVDTTKPVLLGIGPNNSVVSNKQNLSLNISATDGAGVGLAACIVNVGGNPNTTLAASSGWCNMTGISMANLALGATPINIWINDSVGNTLYNNSYTVTIGGNIIPGGTQWNASVPVSLNLSQPGNGDMFFYDGNTVSVIANFTTFGSDGMAYPFDNLTVTGNATGIGASPNIAATPLGNGIYRINAVVNYTNLSASGVYLNGSNVFYGSSVNLQVSNVSSGMPVMLQQPLFAIAVLVNMSTIPSCPPDPSQVPPAIFWNGSMRNTTGCIPMNQAPCNTVTSPVYYNATTGNVTLCGPVFGPATTNFSQIAQNGNFSAVPLVMDIPGRAMINFSANPVDMGSQQKAGAIMQFAMKNLMAQGQFGINESEWNGQGGKPNLNMSATLTLYNVSGLFGNSQYYSISYGSFNGMNAPNTTSLCPPSRCSNIIYANGNLTFTVSSFSSYIIGGVNYTINFANTTSILQSVNPGVNATYLINISNLGNNTNAVTYNLSVQGPGSLNASQITLNSTAIGGTTWAVVQLNVSNATPGTYYSNITAVASDNSSAVFVSLGNGLASQITTTVLDITNPLVFNTTATSASGNPGAVVQISNVNVTEDTNVAQVFVNLTPLGNNTLAPMALVAGNNVSGNYSANITIPYGTLGNYSLLIRANDTGGNVNATQTILLTVNNVPPVVSVNYPTSGFIKGTVTVNATVTDNNGNNTITNVTFYYYNGTYNFIGWQNVSQGNAVYNVSWNTAGLNLANISMFVNATNGVNGANGTGSNFTVDNVAPSLVLVLPSNTTYTSVSRTLNFTATHPLGIISACWYQYNGANTTLSNCANTTFTALNNQQSTLTLFANDSAGNINSTNVTFTIDTTTPAITVLSPLNQTYATTSIWFNITGNKAFNWSGYSLDGAANVTMTNSSGNWNNLSTVSQGQHNVRFYANDSLGNINQSANTIYFTVDSVAPQLSAISVSTNSIYVGSFNFSVTITELNFANASYSIYNATNSSIVWTSNATGITSNGTFASMALAGTYLPVGAWTINVTATDLAGNVNYSVANITSNAAILPTLSGSSSQTGTIGGSNVTFPFQVIAKGFPYVKVFLNLTSGSLTYDYTKAALSNSTGSQFSIAQSSGAGSYTGAQSATLSGITTAPSYAQVTTGIYNDTLTLNIVPYSGISAGTYTGTYGFGLFNSP